MTNDKSKFGVASTGAHDNANFNFRKASSASFVHTNLLFGNFGSFNRSVIGVEIVAKSKMKWRYQPEKPTNRHTTFTDFGVG